MSSRPVRSHFSAVSLFRSLLLLALTLAAVTTAQAQAARWEPSDSGDPSELQLVFENCEPEGDPQLPAVEGVTFSLLGRAEQTSIVNLSMTRSTVLTYRARGQQSGAIRIPAFSVTTNKGAVRVPAFTGGAIRSAADANVRSRLETSTPTVWAGEVFSLTYVLDVARRSFNQLGTNIEWNSAPLAVEEWSKFEPTETTVNGETRLLISSRTRGYAKTAGAVTLNAANQLVNLQSGSIGFGLFQTPRIEQLAVASNQPSLTVRALPSAPAGFSGAVGQFKLTAKVVPTNAAVGEPITWTLELSGTGNWPEIAGLPQREVSKDFSVVQPQARRTPAEGKLFDATLSEDVVLVPTREGSYTLAPVSFTYFDPAKGSYQTISSPRTTLTITAAAAAPSTPSVTPQPAAPAATATPADNEARLAKLPPPPVSPSGLPREPLAGSSIATVPLRDRMLLGFLLLPFALVILFWGWLAVRRARRNDPELQRRNARERLAVTLATLRTARTGNRLSPQGVQLLLEWQHDTATLWKIPHAAPSADAFTEPAAAAAPSPTPKDAAARSIPWAQLWQEADRALYSATPELPADWIERAEAALEAKRVPGFRAYTALLPRNLLPFVAAVALGISFASPHSARAAENGNGDPAGAYRRGDFAVAEKAWTQALATHPTDAVARHNLSLALAQQDRWAEAAAHATAAFVQQPGSAPVRWQLALAAEKAGYIPAPLAGFLHAGPRQTVAQLASPGAWQMILIAAAVLFAAAIAILLLGLYQRHSRLRTWLALSVMVCALIAAVFAMISLRAYGPTADRRAIVVWRAGTLRSIPTEADTTQKTVALPAGSVALETNTFLGWLQLTFENGQTGWVRKEEVIALWR